MSNAGAVRRDGKWPWRLRRPRHDPAPDGGGRGSSSTVLGVLVFYLWPLAKTLYDSFTETGPFGGATWVGAANYSTLVGDAEVYRAILNTVVYTAIVLLGIPLAVLFASLLNRPGLKGAMVYRTLFFLPYVAMPTAISLVWRIIYNGEYGVLNQALGVFGMDGPSWITEPWFALIAVALLGLWMSIGFNMIVLSAGLKDIPSELYEAASLDGAGRRAVPLDHRAAADPVDLLRVGDHARSPGSSCSTALRAARADQPGDAEDAVARLPLLRRRVRRQRPGYAAAVAVVILLVVGLLTLFQFRFQRRWVT